MSILRSRAALVALSVALLIPRVARAAEPVLDNDEKKTLYALGLVLAQNLAPFDLSEADLEILKAGVTDGVLGRTAKVELETYGPKIQELGQSRQGRIAEAEGKAATDFLTKMAAEKGAQKSDSGLIMTELKPGTGPMPAATDKVKVHYVGTLRDGTVFDSSVERGEPVTFPLNQVIPCWTEAVQKMKVGSKWKIVCPSAIAYGDQGAPPKIKPGAALTFEVELLEIVKDVPAPAPAH